MKQNDNRSICRSLVDDVEHEIAASELIHGPTVSRGHATADWASLR